MVPREVPPTPHLGSEASDEASGNFLECSFLSLSRFLSLPRFASLSSVMAVAVGCKHLGAGCRRN